MNQENQPTFIATGTTFDRFFIVRLLLMIMILLGAGLMYFQTAAFFMARESQSWPSTKGILSIHMDQYRKRLSYRYSVDGVSYSSDRVIFGELGNRNRSREWNAVGDLPNGSEIVVHYKPENPQQSTLHTGLLAGSGFHFLLGTVFLLAGAVILAFLPAIKQAEAERRHPAGG